MRYTQTESMLGIYQCPCGESKSCEYTETSTSGNPYGDVFIRTIPYNLGDKYSYCGNCKKYWYDGNAQEWNELSATKKFFFAIGFWLLIQIIPPWIVFPLIRDEGPNNIFIRSILYVAAAILFLPLFFLYDLFLIALMLALNIPFFPIVMIFHWVEIKNSKYRIKHGSPNEIAYKKQNGSNSNYLFDFLERLK